MNQTETQKALLDTKALRGTLEETKQLLDAFEGARRHFAVLADDLAYKLDVIKERVAMQDVALSMIERLLKLSQR